MNDKINQLYFESNPIDDEIRNDETISSNDDYDRNIKFENIGGLHSQIECLKEMIVFPQKCKNFMEKNRIEVPQGVIFHGPPGTGKTLLARALANECTIMSSPMRFISCRSTDFFDKYFGESERKLRALFKEAQKKPTILFFDELDGLCQTRSSDENRAYSAIVCTLLSLMDGFKSRGNTVVIGATNRLDSIDYALRRSGRFDRELYFPLPDLSARKEILRIYLKNKNESLINQISEITHGFSGAELKSLCTEAIFSFLKRKNPDMHNQNTVEIPELDVQLEDFENAKKSMKQPSLLFKGCKLPEYLQPIFKQTIEKISNLINCEKIKKLLIIGDKTATKYICDAILSNADFHLLSIELLLLQDKFDEICSHLSSLPSGEKILIWLGDVSQLEIDIDLILSKINEKMDILILGKSEKNIPNMFSEFRHEIYKVEITKEERRLFYDKLLNKINSAYTSNPKKLKVDFTIDDLRMKIMSETEEKDCELIIDLYWAIYKTIKKEQNDILLKVKYELDRFTRLTKKN